MFQKVPKGSKKFQFGNTPWFSVNLVDFRTFWNFLELSRHPTSGAIFNDLRVPSYNFWKLSGIILEFEMSTPHKDSILDFKNRTFLDWWNLEWCDLNDLFFYQWWSDLSRMSSSIVVLCEWWFKNTKKSRGFAPWTPANAPCGASRPEASPQIQYPNFQLLTFKLLSGDFSETRIEPLQ